MKRIEEFEQKLDNLIKEYDDCDYKEMSDTLDYYSIYLERKIRIN